MISQTKNTDKQKKSSEHIILMKYSMSLHEQRCVWEWSDWQSMTYIIVANHLQCLLK